MCSHFHIWLASSPHCPNRSLGYGKPLFHLKIKYRLHFKSQLKKSSKNALHSLPPKAHSSIPHHHSPPCPILADSSTQLHHSTPAVYSKLHSSNPLHHGLWISLPLQASRLWETFTSSENNNFMPSQRLYSRMHPTTPFLHSTLNSTQRQPTPSLQSTGSSPLHHSIIAL